MDEQSQYSSAGTARDERMGGIALIVAAIGMLVTMSIHPTGHDLVRPGHFAFMAGIGMVAHALGIATMPISFLGALALTRRVASPDRMAICALVVYGCAMAAGLIAATMSGFVAPGVAQRMLSSSGAAGEQWRALFEYTGRVNQAFALVLVTASSVAIALWSLLIVRSRALAWGAGIYGLVISPIILIALFSGHLQVTVFGFGLVVIAQSGWFIVTGTSLAGVKMRTASVAPIAAGLVLLVAVLAMHLLHSRESRIPGTERIDLRSSQVTLPMNAFQGRPTIGVTINGKGPFRFILDSGAGASTIAPDLAEELKLVSKGDVHIGSPAHPHGTLAKIVEARDVVAGDLHLAGVRMVAVALPAFSATDGEAPRGVLSPTNFENYLVTIDYPREKIVIEKGELPAADNQHIFDYRGAYLPHVPLKMGGKEILVDVDSGSRHGLVLPKEYAEELPLVSAPVAADPLRMVDASVASWTANLKGRAMLGAYSFENPEITFAEGLPVGSVGAQMLKRFVITIDFANRRLRLTE